MLTGIGLGMLPLLMADLPEQALSEIAQHHAHWPREPVSCAQLGETISTSYVNCYRGGDAGLRWLEPELPRLSKAFLFKTAIGKSSLTFFHALALVHAYPTASRAEATVLRARLQAIVPRLERERSPFARYVVLGLRLALAVIDERVDEARDLVSEIRRRGESSGDFLSLHAPLYLEGLLDGGDAGLEKRNAALAAYASRGWKNPRRALVMFAPMIDVLEARMSA